MWGAVTRVRLCSTDGRRGLERHERSLGGQHEHEVAIHRWCAARAAVFVLVLFANASGPNRLAIGFVESQGVLPVAAIAHGVDASAGDGHARKAAAHSSRREDLARAALGPRLKQARVGRDAVTIRTAPLRPVARRRCCGRYLCRRRKEHQRSG